MLYQSQLSSPLTPGSLRTTHAHRRLSAHNGGSMIHRWRSLKLETFLRLPPPSPERLQDVPPSRPCLRLPCPHLLLVLSLLLLAGCGPASSDNAPGVASRASMSKPPLSKQGPAPGINPLTPVIPAANPGALASANGTGAVDGPVVPAWMAKELASPNVALETWPQTAPPGAVDPLTQAINDKDERQVGAEALIEEQEVQDFVEEPANQDPNEDGEK